MSTVEKNFFRIYCKKCEKPLIYAKNFPKAGKSIAYDSVLSLEKKPIARGERMPDCECGEGARWRNHAQCELVVLDISPIDIPAKEEKSISVPTSNYFV